MCGGSGKQRAGGENPIALPFSVGGAAVCVVCGGGKVCVVCKGRWEKGGRAHHPTPEEGGLPFSTTQAKAVGHAGVEEGRPEPSLMCSFITSPVRGSRVFQ